MACLFSFILPILFAAAAAFSQMVSVPGGAFSMGCLSGEEDERPVREVMVSPFLIDSREVSYSAYDSCVARGVCSPAHYDDGKCILWTSSGIRRVRVPANYRSADYPVVCVDWHQARQYCSFKGKRLPTEAEWEYAARAGAGFTYTWGEQQPSAATTTMSSRNSPSPCGSFSANGWGLYDMTGNVWEWTSDWYVQDYYSVAERENPRGASVGRYKVIRGGGWYSSARQLRITNRQWFVPEAGEVSIGIRCVK
jgi:formylglycine-generating enzyme required for sulfatase activity